MKKIIYSLVIMIAAGSLFTSCIEPVEPAGIYDLREAKAHYYDALSKLRAADALLVEAKADLKKADAEYRRAEVEFQNLLNEYQRLENEAKKLDNEKEAAKWAMEIEELQKQHELNMINYQGKIAKAQEKLRQTLSEIEMAALDLTEAEKEALADAIKEYEAAYAKYLKAVAAVTKAEAELWDLQYAYNNQYDGEAIYFDQIAGYDDDGNPIYYGESIRTGQDLVEYYESCVEYYTFYAAYFAAMYEEMAENNDIAEWAEELEELKADLAEREYNRYQVTKDSVEYMQNVFHDGNIEFGLEVAAWIEDNPAEAEPKKPTEPKEGDYKAADYMKDSIAFPVFEYKAPNKAYDKFVSLLVGPAGGENYAAVNTLVGDSTNVVLVQDATEKTLTLVANNKMKDFVLGFETPSTDSLEMKYYDKATKKDYTAKAKWGLKGAISLLNRDLVLDDDPGTTPEEKQAAAEAAYKLWNSDRDTILALYAAKKAEKSVAEAYEPLKKALDDLKKAVDDNTTGNGSLAKATEDLVAILNGIIPHSDLSVPDSNALINAIADFATKREAYLNYKFDKKSAIDSNYFHYVRSTNPSVSYDSIEFKKLSMSVLLDANYGPFFPYTRMAADPYWAKNVNGTKAPGLQNIIEEFMGGGIAAKIEAGSGTVSATDLNSVAFYKTFKYVPKSGDTPAQIVYIDGTPYVPQPVTDAIKAVKREVTALNALWDRFWKEDLGATADDAGKVTIPALDDKYNPATYTLDAFTKPYNVVIFDGANIIWTEAIGDILASVDPNKTDNTGVSFNASGYVAGAAIFAGTNGKTDFYDYMFKDAQAKAPSSTDLEEITKWVNAVVAAFEKDVTDAEAAAKKAYEAAKTQYEKDKKTYDTNKKKYDDYMTALKAFVGVDEKDNLINVAKNTAGAYVPTVTSIAVPTDYQSANVKQTQTGAFEWEGEWKLGGTQKELAEKYMPGYPEKLAAWRSTAKENEDEIGHLKAIIDALEKAYMAAIAVDDPKGAAAAKKQVEVYFENYLDYLESMVEYCLANISWYEDAIAKAEAGYDDLQIQIEVAELKLAYAQQKLTDAEIELEVAEAYYNKVMTAILGKN